MLSRTLPTSEITVYGAAGEVTGSMHLLEYPYGNETVRILVDCGLFFPHGEGTHAERERRAAEANQYLPELDWQGLDAIFITHAHTDHIGRLPSILAKGDIADIYCTVATKELMVVTLRDDMRQNVDIRRIWWWSRRSRKKKKKTCVTLHFHPDCDLAAEIASGKFGSRTATMRELSLEMTCKSCWRCEEHAVKTLASRMKTIPYNTPLTIKTKKAAELCATLLPAGHIPGSASVYLEFTEETGERKTPRKVVFSGDRGGEITHAPQTEKCPPADAVLVEGTYGTSMRDRNLEAELALLRQKIGEVVRRGGICLIPVFALDRAQRVLEEIRLAIAEGAVPPKTPVYLYSPVARALSRMYEKNAANPEWFSEEKRSDPGAYSLDHVIMHKNISVRYDRPGIVVATPGMMRTSYSFNIFHRFRRSPKNALFFVGYLQSGSLGHTVREAAKDEKFRQKQPAGSVPAFSCEVVDWRCFSGHADAEEMNRWLSDLSASTTLILVHGDQHVLQKRGEQLRNHAGFSRVVVAKAGIPIHVGLMKKEMPVRKAAPAKKVASMKKTVAVKKAVTVKKMMPRKK